ncbi:MAG: aminopeptidase P family protein [Candidatus Latescibacteria bacterium]|nr:aminopeptidase P family protein [Candidatus Latescibacterota bacterium]
MTTYRLTFLREKLKDIDTLIITNPQNRRFLTGFTGSAGVCFLSKDHAYLATDFRYYTQVEQECQDFELIQAGYDFIGTLPKVLEKMNAKRVGFETDHLTVSEFESYKEAAPHVEWVPTKNLVEDLREVKSVAEIETLRHAIKVTDYAFSRGLQALKPGITEKALQWALKQALFDIDGREPSFDIIVAAGLAGAKPHARPSDAPIPRGVPIVIDMGALVDGYHGDMTRTIVMGEPDDTYRKIYDIVLRAQKAAIDGIRPGPNGRDIDALARDLITDAGYGDNFGHGLGHGVGLHIHEMPRFSTRATDAPLQKNMVITVEPGIYLPDWGGIRIEDVVVVTENGCEILTETPKDITSQIMPV